VGGGGEGNASSIGFCAGEGKLCRQLGVITIVSMKKMNGYGDWLGNGSGGQGLRKKEDLGQERKNKRLTKKKKSKKNTKKKKKTNTNKQRKEKTNTLNPYQKQKRKKNEGGKKTARM